MHFAILLFFLFRVKVVSDGAGFACGRPSFGIAQKKAKTDLGLAALRTRF